MSVAPWRPPNDLRNAANLMAGGGLRAKIDLLQEERDGNERASKDRQAREYVDVGQISRLVGQGLTNPCRGLMLRIARARSLLGEIRGCLLVRLPIGRRRVEKSLRKS